MAAYFDGGNSQIQAADGLQTLIFMNPSYVNKDHKQNPDNFVFANPSISPVVTHQSQQLIGVPLQQNQHYEAISVLHGLVSRPHYNLWTPIVRDNPSPQKGLSLNLSNSQQQQLQVGFAGTPLSAISPSSGSKDDGIGTPSLASVISNSPASGLRSIMLCSKYLKATQQLLEEVVNVGSATGSAKKKDTATGSSSKAATEASSPEAAAAAEVAEGDGENGGKKAAELSTAERHEIQMKKGKLVCMLDEVEQRYRQYQQQMQIVIASFEQGAGQGSARTYTALALQTISRQFRCLKDAIVVQMRAVSKSLGEEEVTGSKEGGSRLKFVDHHLRQQRALQQLGMIQHNAWRPQRGLPERSVSVLRAWLFEHFLHPYPKDSDKHMLAKQAGLTRSQVSNWFINARVRLWKPMVEEMYNEEVKEQENHGLTDKPGISGNNNAEAYASKVPTHDNISFKNASPENTGATAAAKSDSVSPGRLRNQNTGFSLVGSSELEGIAEMSPKRQRTNHLMMNPTDSFQSNMEMKSSQDASNEHVLMQFGIKRQTRDDYSLMAAGQFGSYPMEEINQFDSSHQYQPRFSGNGGVSLTLCLTDTLFPSQNMRRVDTGEATEFGTINNNPNPAHTRRLAMCTMN